MSESEFTCTKCSGIQAQICSQGKQILEVKDQVEDMRHECSSCRQLIETSIEGKVSMRVLIITISIICAVFSGLISVQLATTSRIEAIYEKTSERISKVSQEYSDKMANINTELKLLTRDLATIRESQARTEKNH